MKSNASYVPGDGAMRSAVPPCCSAAESDHRVHVVDDDAAFRCGLSQQLRSVGFAVTEHPGPERFLATYRPLATECLIMDLRMPDMTGVEAQREMIRRCITMPIILVSAFASMVDVVEAMRDGAFDFLEKPVADDVLLKKVHAALRHDHRRKLHVGDLDLRLSHLSDREREVMALLMQAATTHEAARRLGISPKTIENHRAHIYVKLNVASVPELMRLMSPPLNPPS